MNQSERLYHAAQLFELQNNLDAALDCYRKIVEFKPTATTCYNLGIKLYENGHIDEAIKSFCHVISFNPEDADAYYNLGLALFAQKKYKKSIVCLNKALASGDSNAHTYYCMGIAFQAIEEISETILCCQKAIAIDPNHLQAHLSLGSIYKSQRETEKAFFHYREAIKLAPDNTDAFFNLAKLYKNQGDSNNAKSCYHRIITIDPGNAEAYRRFGDILHGQGYIEEAIKYFDKSLTITPAPGLKVRSALALPVINDSQASIKHYRQRLENQLDKLSDRNIVLTDPLTEVSNTSFLLAYHNLNDKFIQQKIASFYLKACPTLGWSAPHCSKPQIANGKIKVGFISTFLFSHTIGYLFFGLIEKLSKKDFHTVVFRFPGNQDPMSAAIDQAANEVVRLPYELDGAREIIANTTLNILFYLDIGMVPITYFLAFSRLAPVQCLSYGHPVTSGIPNLDYFITCDKAETSDAQQHYSEQLVRFVGFNFYYPPAIPSSFKQRDDKSLSATATLYVCPQSLFKFHPDFDSIFVEILRQDPSAILVLVEGRETSWSNLLLKRLSLKLNSNELARISALPRMSAPDFLSLCVLADTIIDTPGFTGGKTSLDCFALGLPVVTLPSPYMRGRVTLALYELMGIRDCVAKDSNDFIEIALRLAHDKTWKATISEKIKKRSPILFKNSVSLKELELFFAKAVKQIHENVNEVK